MITHPMGSCTVHLHLLWLALLLALPEKTITVVDESGRYRQGGDISNLAPPEPTDEDRNASVDLSKQPIEKLFQLLSYELWREEKRPPERRLSVREFQDATEISCQERLIGMMRAAQEVSEEVRIYHLNVTGTAGLYWLLHKYPEEHSWVWLIALSQDRVLRKVGHYLSRLSAMALDDGGVSGRCLSSSFRTILMNAAASFKKIHGDYIALLWNGVAFGVLGDVTSWREVEANESEDGQQVVEEGPGGPPPNVSWSENLIFGNMWISSVQKWLQYHAQELAQAAYAELARAQAALPLNEERDQWQHGHDGTLAPFEFLRQQLWGGWQLDKGLVRGVLRHCLRPTYGDKVSLADFGAGGGLYSEWLNDTGLVEAVAFDATEAVGDITGGSVQQANLTSQGLQLWRTFDWVLCLDVGALLPADQSQALFSNIRQYARHGLVMSWSSDHRAPGVVNALSKGDFIGLVEHETGFSLDTDSTRALQAGCELNHFAQSVAVFRVSNGNNSVKGGNTSTSSGSFGGKAQCSS